VILRLHFSAVERNSAFRAAATASRKNDGNTCAAPIVLPNIDPMASTLNPTFNFNTPFNGQWIVMLVTGVTSP
jgi:hypothetical protein